MKYWLLLFIVFSTACSTSQKPKDKKAIKNLTYLALGDSYTIGESVEEKDRWPNQLYKKLQNKSIKIEPPIIIAATGWTTNELLEGIIKAKISPSYDLVSLLIGVNNQFRRYPIEQYKNEFRQLLNEATKLANNKADRVFVVSIPDYGVTPFSINKNLNSSKIAKELDKYNRIAQEIATEKGCSFTNITTESKLAKTDPLLVAPDGLHPSGKMYEQWADKVLQKVLLQLR